MTDQVNEPIDIFAMSDDDFANLDLDTFGSEESASADSFSEEPVSEIQEVESTTEEVEDELQEDEHLQSDVEDHQEQFEESEEEQVEVDSLDEETVETTENTFDYETEYKKLIGSTIRANGKDITIGSVDEAQKLIQMGANYYEKMESLKPARKVLAMLEQNELMDEEKLSFAIDLLNKNPQAINKLIADQDLSDIMDEEKGEYKPTNYAVSEQQLNVTEALDAIKHTETYTRTVNVLGTQWDAQSRDIVTKSPEVIDIINNHIADGTFDKVSAEVERRKLFGSIPTGTPDIIAYKTVGDELYANNVPAQNVAPLKANAPKPPIRKPQNVVRQEKLSTSKPRGKTSISNQFEDVFSMSSDTFAKKFGTNI